MSKNYGALPASFSNEAGKPDDIRAENENQVVSLNRKSVLRHASSLILLTGMLVIVGFVGMSSREHITQSSLSSENESSSESKIIVTNRSKSKPNFVFFMIDDLPWNAIGYQDFDFKFVTPNIVKFAEDKGIIVNSYYAQELCTPSRASLMTGRYPASIGRQYSEIEVNQVDGLRLSEKLIPEVLKDEGYKNYMIGKWNLGNSDVRYLPTRRGFDEFFGYLGGGVNPYTKTAADSGTTYVDFMYSDKECYNLYDEDDFGDYTTYLFRDKAIHAIKKHDFESNPMFMYLAFHGVHSPLSFKKQGIDGDDIGDKLYGQIEENIVTSGRQAIAAVLALIDDSIRQVYESMKEQGQEENTYFIVTSDNGGCNDSGGFNGPLRGCKGSLWEGGTRVDAMMFGKILPESVRGSTYNGLMHTSDWFPTMLELAGIDYTPTEDRAFDGVSQAAAMLDGRTSKYPRTEMLYNVFYHVSFMDFDLETYTSAAVRYQNFKLIHTFTDSEISKWYQYDSGDTDLEGRCDPFNIMTGSNFTKLLFNLEADPYETNNLYDLDEYKIVQNKLTELLYQHAEESVQMDSAEILDSGITYFMENGGFAQPFIFPDDVEQKPQLCSKNTVFYHHSDT